MRLPWDAINTTVTEIVKNCLPHSSGTEIRDGLKGYDGDITDVTYRALT